MSCLPTDPCYRGSSNVSSGTNCGSNPCDNNLKTSNLIKYVGPNLNCTEIKTCDDLTIILQKIEQAICELQQCCAGTTTTTTSTSSTTTTTSSTTTTTTTTTICPCSIFEFVGTDVGLNVFNYVPCGGTLYEAISSSSTPEYRCVNLAYPVIYASGNTGSFTNTQECCPTTTTTTTLL